MNIRCPKHEDSTPSLTIYANGGWCHGGCGLIALDKLGIKPEDVKQEERYVEDIEQSIQRIKTLPTRGYRGFCLYADSGGVYVLWPNMVYYKYRRFSGNPKYIGPAGHSPPPFWVRQETSDTLLIVEGEFEAMSVALAMPEFDVMSPGSASNFGSKSLLTHLKPYAKLILMVDNDKAGIEAAINLGALVYNGLPGVPLKKIFKSNGDTDLNDLLVQFGKERLREEIIRMFTRLPR